jgi:hypothetical protein
LIIVYVLTGMVPIIFSFTPVLSEDATPQLNTPHAASGPLGGSLTCPNGDSSSATLLFAVEDYHDYRGITGTAGNFHLAALQVGGVGGVLTGGHVGEKSFRTTGSEVIGNDFNTLTSDLVISGKCRIDGTILYKAEDKVIGRFTGYVDCFTRQCA